MSAFRAIRKGAAMKKEAVKEKLEKAKEWMKVHKKEVVPAVMAVAALAACRFINESSL